MGKLLKHDMKNNAKLGSIILGLGLVANFLIYFFIPRIGNSINNTFYIKINNINISAFIIFFSFLAIFASVIGLIFMIVSNYRKDYYTDRSYLMATLPVTSKDILNSKLLFGLIWIFIFTVAFVLVNMLSWIVFFQGWSVVKNILPLFRQSGFSINFLTFAYLILDPILKNIFDLLILYFSIVASKAIFPQSKTGYSWVAITIFVSTIISMLDSKLTYAFPKALSLIGDGIVDYTNMISRFTNAPLENEAVFLKEFFNFFNQLVTSIPIVTSII